MTEHRPLIIIGAGPAGMAAAITAARHGLSPVLLDEQPGPGGQIYRAIESTPLRNRPLLGEDYWRGQALAAALHESDIDYRPGHVVWQLTADREVGVLNDGAVRRIDADRIIIATGARERPFPIPGWTLPGVMGAGAAQVLLKSSGLAASGPLVLAGCGPLLYLVAVQYHRAGVPIAAVLDTTPHANYRRASRHAPGALRGLHQVKKGLSLLHELKRAKINRVTGVTRLHAQGDGHLQCVRWQSRRTGEKWSEMAADTLLLHQGVVPNLQMSRALGAAHDWDERQLCWQARVDDWGACTVENVFIAGDNASIGGANVAELRGRIAALAALASLGTISAKACKMEAASLKRRLKRELAIRPFLDTLYRPDDQWRRPEGDTVVCRCEEVTAEEIRRLARLGCMGPNQMKAFTRCGMGPCQGRMCGLTVGEILAHEIGHPMEEIGYYRIRSPLKPITLAQFAKAAETTDVADCNRIEGS